MAGPVNYLRQWSREGRGIIILFQYKFSNVNIKLHFAFQRQSRLVFANAHSALALDLHEIGSPVPSGQAARFRLRTEGSPSVRAAGRTHSDSGSGERPVNDGLTERYSWGNDRSPPWVGRPPATGRGVGGDGDRQDHPAADFISYLMSNFSMLPIITVAEGLELTSQVCEYTSNVCFQMSHHLERIFFIS